MIKKTILITGGAGFIGSHLVDELLARNYDVVCLDNLINGSLDNLKIALGKPNFKFIKGDILNERDCLKSTKTVDIVFHLACLGIRHSIHSPLENQRVNAEGTLQMLRAARINKVKKFFYISSSEIYGDVKHFPIMENYVPAPTTIYGASKLAGEHYAIAYNRCYGLDTTILRIFNNFGPRAHYEGDAGEIIPRTIIATIYNKSPVVFGGGQTTRDYFYVKDTVRALADLINYSNLTGEIINIGAGKETKIIDIVKKILKLMGKQNLQIVHAGNRPADLPRLWVNANKFYRMTHFKPAFDFEQGLKETIAYYENLSHGKSLYKKIKLKNWEK
jgi:UDP-glucose 4-epimerase